MDLKTTLQKYGLNEKQASVYLALLELGSAPASQIATKANLKRPTTYVILNELKEQGLAQEAKNRSTTFFTPASPEKLTSDFQARLEALEQSLPDLKALYKDAANENAPQISLHEGKEGFEEIYEQFLEDLGGQNEALVFSTLSHVKKEFSHLLERWHKTLKRKDPSVRELLVDTQLARAYKQEVEKLNNNHHTVKLQPGNLPHPSTEFFLNGDTILFVNLNDDIWVLKIKNPLLADSYKALFETAWKQSN